MLVVCVVCVWVFGEREEPPGREPLQLVLLLLLRKLCVCVCPLRYLFPPLPPRRGQQGSGAEPAAAAWLWVDQE